MKIMMYYFCEGKEVMCGTQLLLITVYRLTLPNFMFCWPCIPV